MKDALLFRLKVRIRNVKPGSSRIRDPEFFPTRISVPKTAKRRWENLLSYYFCIHKFHKMENYWFFEQLKEKDLSQFTTTLSIFNPKNLIVTKLSENMGWIRDTSSGIRKKTYPGFRIRIREQKERQSRIRNRNSYSDPTKNLRRCPCWRQKIFLLPARVVKAAK